MVSVTTVQVTAGLNFTSNATTPYTITLSSGGSLTLESGEISNNSGVTQNFNVSGDGSQFNFNAAGTITGPVLITNQSGVAALVQGGSTVFESGASAGDATIINQGGTLNQGLGGSLQFFGGSAGSASITTNGGTVSGASGGTLLFRQNSTAGSATIDTEGGTNGGTGGSTVFEESTNGGTASAITNGSGTFSISNNGNTTIGSIAGSGTYILGGNTFTVGGNNSNTTVSGVIEDGNSGSGGSLVKTGTGTLIFSGANTYTGSTTVNGGILQLGNLTNAGSITAGSNISINSGGTLSIVNVPGTGGVSTFTNNITNGVSGVGTLNINSSNANYISSAITDGLAGQIALTQTGSGGTILTSIGNTYTGATTISNGGLQIGGVIGGSNVPGSLNAASAISIAGGANLTVFDIAGNTLGNKITAASNNATVNITSTQPVTITGQLGGSINDLLINVSGSAILASNASSLFGTTTVQNGGTLQIGTALTGGGVSLSHLVVDGGGTLIVTNVASPALFGVSGGATGPGPGVVNVNSALSVTFQDALTDGAAPLSLQQTGTGTTTLEGTSSYSGPTTVSAGTLVVNASLTGGSTVTVSGGTLTGISTINGTVDLTGGTIIPGNTTASVKFTIGTLNLSSGFSDFKLGAPGANTNDQIVVSNNVSLGGSLNIIPQNGFGVGTYTLYRDGSSSGNFTAVNGLPGYLVAISTATSGQVQLIVSYLGTAQSWAGGNGNWNTSATNWTDVGGPSNVPWASGTAIFNSPSGVVTLTSPVSAQALVFNTGGYTLTGMSSLTMTGSSPTISVQQSGAPLKIGVPIAGSVGLNIGGSGNVELTAVNTYTGTTNIVGGTLQIGDVTTQGSINSSPINVQNGATLSLENLTATTFPNNISNGLEGVGTVKTTFLTVTLSGTLTDGAAGQLALDTTIGSSVILTNAHNTYSGPTTVTQSTLQIGTTSAPGSIGPDSPVQIHLGGILSLINVAGGIVANNISGNGGSNGMLSASSTGTLTLSGMLSDAIGNGLGTLALVQSGTGTTILTGTDIYTGSTSVNAGTLQIGNGVSGNLVGTGSATTTVTVTGATLALDQPTGSTMNATIVLAKGATLNSIQNGNLAINGVISGTGTFNLTGGGTTELVSAETYTGSTNITSGTLQVDTSLAAGNTVNVGTHGTLTGVGTIGGNVTLTGNGNINFLTNASHSGNIVGTLSISGGNWIGSGSVGGLANSTTGTFTIANGAFLTAKSGLDISGGTLAGTGTLFGNLNYTSVGTSTFGGVIADQPGTPSTVTVGAGTLILSGAQTYTGATFVNAGTLEVDGSLAMGTEVLIGSAGKLTGGGTINGRVVLNGGGVINLGSTGIIANTLTVGGGNWNGLGFVDFGVTSNSGTFTIGSGAELSDVYANDITISGGTLSGTGIINGSFVYMSTANSTFAGTFTAGSVVEMLSSATLTLTGNNAALTNLQVTEGHGTVQIGNGTAGSLNPAANVQVDGTLALDLANNGTFASTLVMGFNGGTVNAIQSGTTTISSAISGVGTFNQNGTGTTILTGMLSYNGATNVNHGTLQLGDGTSANPSLSGSISVANGATLALDMPAGNVMDVALNGTTATIKAIQSTGTTTVGGAITGTGAFIQSGTGTTILAGANTYTGTTTISAGTLEVDGALGAKTVVAIGTAGTLTGIGTVLGNVTMTGNGIIDFTTNNFITGNISGTLGVTGGSWNGIGSVQGLVTSSAGTFTIGGGASMLTGNGVKITGGTFAGTGEVIGNLTYTSSANSTFAGDIASTSTLVMNSAPATLTLTGGNGYSGATTVSAGILQLAGSGTLATNGITVSGTGVFELAINDTATFDTSVSLSASGAAFKGTNPFGTQTISSVIMGSGSFSQIGAGTTVIDAAVNELYTGATNITAGTLEVDGSLASGSTVNVGTNGTLAGSGSINGKTTLTGNGAIDLDSGTIDNTLTVTGGNWTGTGTVEGVVTSASGNFVVAGGGDLTALLGVNVTGGTLGGAGTINGSVNYTSSASSTFGGMITGSGSLTMNKMGSTLILTGPNSYSGSTNISAGTVQLGDGVAAHSSLGMGSVNVSGTGTLALNLPGVSTFGKGVTLGATGATMKMIQSGITTLSGPVGGLGGLTQAGPGTTILTGSMTYTGATNINAGTLQADTRLTGSGAVTVNSGGALAGTSLLISGPVTVLAGGTLSPGDSGNTPGTLTVGALTLKAGAFSDFRLATPGTTGGGVNDLVIVNGNLTLAGNLDITELTNFTTGQYTLFTYTGKLTNSGITAINGIGGFDAVISASGGQVILTIATATTQNWDGTGGSGGSGTWNNTSRNWTTVGDSAKSSWAGGSAVFGGTGGTVMLGTPINAQALDFTANNYTLSGTSSLNLVGTASVAPTVTVATGTATISAPVGGISGVAANGAGTLILSNSANSYTGGTTITTGTVQLGTTAAAGSIGSGAISVANGATLSVLNVKGNTVSNAISNVVGGSGTLLISSTLTNTFSGALTDGGSGGTGTLAVTQSGTGTTILTNSGNNYSGPTTVNKGTLQIGTSGTSGVAGALSPNTTVTMASGTTLALTNVSGGTVSNNIANTTSGTALVNVNSAGSTTLSGVLSNSGSGILALTQSGTGTTILNGAEMYTGATTVSAGTLQIGDGSTGNLNGTTVTVSGTGSLAIDLGAGSSTFGQKIVLSATGAALKAIASSTNTISGVISGTGLFDQNGTGTTKLINIETYTGVTNVTAGTLEVDGGLATGSTVNVGTNGTLDGSGPIGGKVTVTGNGMVGANITGTLTATGGNWINTATVTGPVTVSSGIFAITLNSTLISTGGFTLAGGTLTGLGTLEGKFTDTSSTSQTFTGAIADRSVAGSGSVVMNKAGATLTLNASNNSYTGPTTVTAGTLQIGDGTSGSIASTSAVSVSSGATLALNLPGTPTFSNSVANSGHVSDISASDTISGVISGAGNFLKSGGGTTTLTAANTYSGGTTISGATLRVNSGTGTGAVTVNNGGTLGGTGKITGATTLNSGGTIEPSAGGGAVGTIFTASSLTWNGNSTLAFQATAGGTSDELVLTGALTKGTAGTFTIDLINAGLNTTANTDILMTFKSTTFSLSDFTPELPMNVTGKLAFNTNKTELEFINLMDPPPSSQSPNGDDTGGELIVSASNNPSNPQDGTTNSVRDLGSSTSDLGATTVSDPGAPTPEPGSALLLTLGAGTLLGWRRRRRM